MNYQLIENKNWKEVEINSEKKQIPNHWSVNKFVKEFTRWIDHRGISPQKTLDNKQIPLLTTKVIKKGFMLPPEEFITKEDYEKRCKRGFLKRNDLILTTEAPAGNIAFFNENEKYALGQRMIALASDTNINLYFKYLFIGEYFTNLFQKVSNGSTAQGITTKVLKELELIIPNVNEQLAMANIFSKQESIISNIEKLIEKNEIIFNELSEQLLSGELRLKENDGKVFFYRNPEDNWKEVEINGKLKNIPREWDINNFLSKSEFISGVTLDKKDLKNEKSDNDTYFLRANNIEENGTVNFENLYYIEISVKEEQYLQQNDILICLASGSKHLVGKTALVKNLPQKSTIGSFCGIIRTNDLYKYFITKNEDYRTWLSQFDATSIFNLKRDELLKFEYKKPQESEALLITNFLFAEINKIQRQKTLLTKEKEKFEWLLDNLLSGNYLVKEV